MICKTLVSFNTCAAYGLLNQTKVSLSSFKNPKGIEVLSIVFYKKCSCISLYKTSDIFFNYRNFRRSFVNWNYSYFHTLKPSKNPFTISYCLTSSEIFNYESLLVVEAVKIIISHCVKRLKWHESISKAISFFYHRSSFLKYLSANVILCILRIGSEESYVFIT